MKSDLVRFPLAHWRWPIEAGLPEGQGAVFSRSNSTAGNYRQRGQLAQGELGQDGLTANRSREL
jgi:hypothetical protein